jgi:hypothetical protein
LLLAAALASLGRIKEPVCHLASVSDAAGGGPSSRDRPDPPPGQKDLGPTSPDLVCRDRLRAGTQCG